jgi:hypothetical protein
MQRQSFQHYLEDGVFYFSLDSFTIAATTPVIAKIEIEHVSVSDCNRKERSDQGRGGAAAVGWPCCSFGFKQYG